jgi:hypothetical protein
MCGPPVLNNLHVTREALNISAYRLDFWKTLFTPAIQCPAVQQEVNDELAGAERKGSSWIYSGILLEVMKKPVNKHSDNPWIGQDAKEGSSG